MKFYIASSITNYKQVQYLANKLRVAGWTQTFDWTMHLAEETNINFFNDMAKKEFLGVKEADTVIVLQPEGKGTHTEFGMAIALNKTVYLCHSDNEYFMGTNCTFYWLPQVIQLTGSIDEICNEILFKHRQ